MRARFGTGEKLVNGTTISVHRSPVLGAVQLPFWTLPSAARYWIWTLRLSLLLSQKRTHPPAYSEQSISTTWPPEMKKTPPPPQGRSTARLRTSRSETAAAPKPKPPPPAGILRAVHLHDLAARNEENTTASPGTVHRQAEDL